ncbi:MAG TPA: cytochrome c [Xanthobacteraceae bacterium]
MRRVRLLLGVLGAGLVMLGGARAQLNELPAGPGREIVSHECQACHDLGMVLSAAGLSRAGWEATIEEMTSYGLHVTPEERMNILDYLSSFLGPASVSKPAGQ